mgnify:CR=1 FL=1
MSCEMRVGAAALSGSISCLMPWRAPPVLVRQTPHATHTVTHTQVVPVQPHGGRRAARRPARRVRCPPVRYAAGPGEAAAGGAATSGSRGGAGRSARMNQGRQLQGRQRVVNDCELKTR